MDFFQQLESELHALSSEARKKYPEVAEASERAVARVRKMREQYAAAVRQGQGEAPHLSIFRSQDLLRPFLLACNHADASAKITSMALGSLQHVIQRDVLSPGDCPNVMRVLAIQAAGPNRDPDAQVKVLQTLVMVVNWKSCDMTEETVGQALSVCMSLHRAKTPRVRSAAHMTVRQLVRLLFDRLAEEERGRVPSCSVTELPPIVRGARRLFLDLCLLVKGEAGTWLKASSLRRDVGLELIEDTISQHSDLFSADGVFSDLIVDSLCPLLRDLLASSTVNFGSSGGGDERRRSGTLSSPRHSSAASGSASAATALPLLARLVQTTGTVVANFGEQSTVLSKCGELLVGLQVHLDKGGDSSTSAVSMWATALALEALRRILYRPSLIFTLYKTYELGEEKTSIVTDLIQCLPLFSSGLPGSSGASSGWVTAAMADGRKGREPLTRALLHAADAADSNSAALTLPTLSHVDVSFAALLCSVEAARALAALTMSREVFRYHPLHILGEIGNEVFPDAASISMVRPFIEEWPDDTTANDVPGGLRSLCELCWPSLLASTGASNNRADDAALLPLVVETCCCTSIACGALGAADGLEATLSVLCNAALPMASGSQIAIPQWHISKSLLWLVHILGDVLGPTWHVALQTLDNIDTACRSGVGSGGEDADPDAGPISEELVQALRRLPLFTSGLSESSLMALMISLSTLSATALAAEATTLPSDSTPAATTPASSAAAGALGIVSRVGAAVWQVGGGSSNVTAVKDATSAVTKTELGPDSFLMRTMVECLASNATRAQPIWDLVAAHLRVMARSHRKSLCEYAMTSLHRLMVQILQGGGELSGIGVASTAAGDEPKVIFQPASSEPLLPPVPRERAPGEEEREEELEQRLFSAVRLFARVPRMETREAALEVLDSVLQSCGQLLQSAWRVVLQVLADVARGGADMDLAAAATAAGQSSEGDGSSILERTAPRLAPVWGGNCLMLAFNTLKLIVDDFLDRVPSGVISELISCMGAFGSQTENVNLSLTAIGMIWTACDHLTDHARAASWGAMLSELQILAVDRRPEVRNCAIHTLFSALTGNGSLFSSDQWRHYLVGVTFPLLDQILNSRAAASATANTGVAPELKKGVKMVMHHSRDTDRKQWDESAVLALQGVCKLMRGFARQLAAESWFCDEVWRRVLPQHLECCRFGPASQEVVLASIDGLATLVQLSSRGGLSLKEARISTDMRVVDGMLRSTSGPAEALTCSATQTLTDAFVDSSFDEQRTWMWTSAWTALEGVAGLILHDESGDIVAAYARALIAVYKTGSSGMDGEFAEGTKTGPAATIRMLQLMDLLVLPPPPSINAGASAGDVHDVPPVREAYRPSISSAQRIVLEFLREVVCSAWPAVLSLLARYSFGAGDVGVISEACACESASVLVHVLQQRCPPSASLQALPSILREALRPCRAASPERPLQDGDESSARFDLRPSYPADTAHTARLKFLRQILDNIMPHLSAAETTVSPGWIMIIDALREFGVSWSQGRFRPQSDAVGKVPTDCGDDFSLTLQEILESVSGCLESAVLPSEIVTEVSASPESWDIAQSLLQAAGDICCCQLGMLGQSGFPPVIPATHSVLDQAVRILYRAAGGVAEWASAPMFIRRVGTWELLRATFWALDWHDKVEDALRGCMQAKPSSPGGRSPLQREIAKASDHAEHFCLVVLRAACDLDIFQSGLVTLNLVAQVEAMVSAPMQRPPANELKAALADEINVAEGEDVGEDMSVGGPPGAAIFLPLCPILLKGMGADPRSVRQASGDLLQRIDIPSQLTMLQDEVLNLRDEVMRLRAERNKAAADSYAASSLFGGL